MKEKLFRMFRSGISLLLALCMVVGMMPGVAFAEEAEKETLNYVSIGDSMANGYGFVGYEQNSNDINKYNFMTGHGMYGLGAYPLQFEEYLTEQGYEVNHTKLATSAMLPDDLLYLLDGRPLMDDGWNGYLDYVGPYTDEQIKPYVQKAIKEADLITMGIGNAGFGAFMLDRVTSALGVFGASLDKDEKLTMENAIAHLEKSPEEQKTWMAINTIIDNIAGQYLNEESAAAYDLDLAKVQDALGIVKYTAASFIINYTDLVEMIVKINPDVNVILVGLLNTTYGMNVTDDEGNVILEFGNMMDELFDVLNAYMAAIPTTLGADGDFYFAEQPNPKFICQVFDDLHANGWKDIDLDKNGEPRLSGTTVRERNISAYNDSLAEMIGKAVNGTALPSINLADVKAYENLDFAALKAQVEAAGMGAYWSPWAAFYFSGYITDKDTAIATIMSVAIYLAIEEAVANATNTMDIQLSGLLAIAGDMSSVFTALGTPPKDSPESTRTWLFNGLSSDKVQGMCKIYGLFKVGNGMSVHPTPTGHDEIVASVIKAYEEGHTAEKETDENLEGIEGMPVLMDIYTYLRSNNLIETEQTYSIINFLLERLNDETLSGEELMETARFVYETLLYNDKLTDKQRIDIVENVCDILAQHGYLDSYKKELDVLDQIVALPELAYVTDEQAFDIVDRIYLAIEDGNASDEEVNTIVASIYGTLFNENVADADKVAAIKAIYEVLKANGYLSDDSGELPQALVLLEEILALPELENVTDKQAFAIFDLVFKAIADSTIDDDEMKEIADSIYAAVMGDESELTVAEKISLIMKLYDIAKANGYLSNVDADSLALLEEILALPELEKVTDEQAFAIFKKVIAAIEDGEIGNADMKAIAEFIYKEVLGDNSKLTDAEKVSLIMKLYDIAKENGYLSNVDADALAILEEVLALPELENVTDEQAFAIFEKVIAAIEDGEIGDADMKAIAEFIYDEVLGENSELTDAEKVSLIIKLYNIAKKYGFLNNVDGMALKVLEEIIALPELSKITPAQTFAIFNKIVTAIRDGAMEEAEMGEIADAVYEVVLGGDSLTEAEKVSLIEKVYNILKDNGYLDGIDGDLLKIMEEIVALPELAYLSDEDVMNMVDFIADAVMDGTVDETDAHKIATFVYDTVFKGEATAAQKLAAIEALYGVLESNGILDADTIPALKAVIDVYKALTEGEGDEQLLSDEKIFAIIDKVFTAVLESKGQITDETAKNLAMEIVTDVFTDSEISAAAKAELVLVVYRALKGNGLITSDVMYGLLAQLAEMLKVYGPDIAEGVYKYADEQGYIEALEAAVAELEAMMAAKLEQYADIVMPEIEDAMVNMEAELAILRDELAELKAELEIKKAELEALRGEVKGEIEDTFAPNAMTPNSVEEVVEQGEEAVEAAIAHLEAAIAIIEEAIAQVEAKIAQIEKAIAELKALIEEINAELMELAAAVEDMVQKVNHVVEVLKDAAIDTVEAAQEIYVEARDVAVAAVNVVETAFAEAEDIAAAFVVLAETINSDVIDLYNYAIEQAEDAWNSLDPEEQAIIIEITKELTAEAEAAIEKLYAEHADEIAAFEAELAAAQGDLDALLAVIEAEIEEQAAALNAELELQLAEKLAELEACAEEMKPVIEAEIAEIRAQIEANVAKVRAEVEAAYAEAKAQIEAKIAEITAALEALMAEIEKKVAQIRAELEAAIAELMEVYNLAMAEAKVAIDALMAHIQEKMPVVEAYAKVAIEQIEVLVAEIQEKVEEAIAAFEAAYIRATTDDYLIYADSKLVAIGDGSAVSTSYVDNLAEALDIDVTNLAADGTILDAPAIIAANVETIASADLITVGYGNNAFTSEAIEQVLAQAYSGNPTEYDWSAYVGEEGVAYVEQALAEINAYLVENGMSDMLPMSKLTMADAMTYLLEAYAYSAVSYACYLPEVVNSIHSINPDAVVVVVGMNNSFAGTTLTMDENTSIALGDYIKYLVDGADLHGLIYAMLSGNCIYVAAPDAETDLAGNEYSVIDFVMSYGRFVDGNPTEAGHAYITEQILNALRVSCGHDWTEWTVTVEPTKNTTGLKERTCRLCGAVETEVIPALGRPTVDGLYRLKGKDRYLTGLAVAEEVKQLMGVGKFETVVVAYGEKFPDALTGSYLAAKYDAPILLTDKKVDADVIEYINNNVVAGGKVFILGGEAAVTASFESALKEFGFNVERLKGADRYGTNLAILNKAGVDGNTEILIATGNNYADSLSASATGLPMLLVNKKLTAEQKAFLEGTSKKFTILGGTAAVSAEIEAELAEIGEVVRVKGATRYETSVVIAERYFTGANPVVLAYGEAFPDGLCGGPLANLIGGPLVLTHNDKLAAADAYVNGIDDGYVTGGTARLSDAAVREIFDVDATTEITVKE